MEDISQSIDNGEEINVVYLDFCKAIYKVQHQGHLQKLYTYGFRGKVCVWVKESLSNRVQRMIANGSKSVWIKIPVVYPKGSVIGPVLFLVFVNDLPDVMKVLTKLFADDAKLYSVVSGTDDHRVQFSLNRGIDWVNVWG